MGAPAYCQSTTAAETYGDDARLKELILEVIKENPQVIYESLDNYLKNQRKAQAAQELENSFKNRVEYQVPSHAPWKGAADAPITIVEYTDFECTFCAKGAGILKELEKKYPGKLKIVFRHNPLKMHTEALPAAKAAMAAHQQGKFWEYHDLLFENMKHLNEDAFVDLAGNLELDMDQFNAERGSEAIAQQIAADQEQAVAHKFTGTPMFIVNGVVVQGAKPATYFSTVIDRLLTELSTGS
jgi:protein-disulfide isomerase